MRYTLNGSIAGVPQELSKFRDAFCSQQPLSFVDSREFNELCRLIIDTWRGSGVAVPETSAHAELLDAISSGQAGSFPTPWGGVVVTLHEHPNVEKYLVLKRGGYLAYEKHEQKRERLTLQEGAAVLLSRSPDAQKVSVQLLLRGSTASFDPQVEHCLIGIEDAVVFEVSVDPKGMDQDLIFLFEPEQR